MFFDIASNMVFSMVVDIAFNIVFTIVFDVDLNVVFYSNVVFNVAFNAQYCL